MEYDWSRPETRRRASIFIITEGKKNGKRDGEGRPRTSYIKKMITDSGLTNYKKLNRLAGNRDERRNYEKRQNQF